MYKAKVKLAAQWEYCDKEMIPFAVLVGPDELKNGCVRVKEQRGKGAEGAADKGELVKIDELAAWVKGRL